MKNHTILALLVFQTDSLQAQFQEQVPNDFVVQSLSLDYSLSTVDLNSLPDTFLPDVLFFEAQASTTQQYIEFIGELTSTRFSKKKPFVVLVSECTSDEEQQEVDNLIAEKYIAFHVDKQHLTAQLSTTFLAVRHLVHLTADNTGLQEQLHATNHSRVGELSVLNQIGLTLSTLNTQKIIDIIAQELPYLMPANIMAISLYDSATNLLDHKLLLINHKAYIGETEILPDNHTPFHEVIRRKRPVLLKGLEGDTEVFIPSRTLVSVLSVHDLLSVPLTEQDEVRGFLTLVRTSPQPFSDHEQQLLAIFANQLSAAFINADLYENMKQKVVERVAEIDKKNTELEQSYYNITILGQIGQFITGTLNQKDIITTVYENMRELINPTVLAIALFNKESNSMEYELIVKYNQYLPTMAVSMEDTECLLIQSASSRKEILVDNVVQAKEEGSFVRSIEIDDILSEQLFMENDRTIGLDDEMEETTRLTGVYIPLLVEDRLVGVMEAIKIGAFSSYKLDMFRTLASYTAIAIDNAAAYEELARSHKELTQTQAQLIHSERMNATGMLVAGVMHEINNPNAAVSSAVDSARNLGSAIGDFFDNLLDDDGKDSEEARTFTSMIEQLQAILGVATDGSHRIRDIVSTLRDFGKHQESSMKVGLVKKEIESTTELFKYQFKDVIVTSFFEREDLEIAGNISEINQVFLNLCINAAQAKATKLHISAKSTSNGGVVVAIQDNGLGIPPEIQAKIFEPFFTTKGAGNSGLGLNLSRKILSRCDATMELESVAGEGTTFTITFPSSDEFVISRVDFS